MRIIKIRLKMFFLSFIYDLFCELADMVLKKHNPCKFDNGKCAADDNCCLGCNHLSSDGCTVKALACKLWLCSFIQSRHPKCLERLNFIKEFAIKFSFLDDYGGMGFRESKGEAMERLYYERVLRGLPLIEENH